MSNHLTTRLLENIALTTELCEYSERHDTPPEITHDELSRILLSLKDAAQLATLVSEVQRTAVARGSIAYANALRALLAFDLGVAEPNQK